MENIIETPKINNAVLENTATNSKSLYNNFTFRHILLPAIMVSEYNTFENGDIQSFYEVLLTNIDAAIEKLSPNNECIEIDVTPMYLFSESSFNFNRRGITTYPMLRKEIINPVLEIINKKYYKVNLIEEKVGEVVTIIKFQVMNLTTNDGYVNKNDNLMEERQNR